MYLDKPFEIGDWISSPDRSIEGVVELVGWRLTKIRTADKCPIYVPNSVFNSIIIENTSRMSHRRIQETISIKHSDLKMLEKITADIKSILRTYEEIDSAETTSVFLTHVHRGSFDIEILAFTKTTEWIKYQHIKQYILLKVCEIISGNGAQITSNIPCLCQNID